jgi:predicted alpha/beta-fold hydrolase
MQQTRITKEIFLPALGLRNTHVQSVLNSTAYRRRIVEKRCRPLLEAEQEWIVDGGNGIRLLGHYSAQAAARRGLVVLFHGWEGSSRSNYIVSLGGALFERGYDVFRFNFRDHGDSHHLNSGIFHSCLLGEVIHALKDIQQRTNARNWALAGYSLGGNFALRAALNAPSAGLSLRRVIAVSPVVSPANVLKAMEDAGWGYESYYVRKWARSLQLKQALFPDAYDYAAWYQLEGLREKTRFMATHHYEFESLEDYFDGYSIAKNRLAALAVPTTILASEDDMVVPASDFQDLPENECIELLVTRHGGHCAFLKNWRMESLADDVIVERVIRTSPA